MSIPGSVLGEYSQDSSPPYLTSSGGTRASWEANSSLVLPKLLQSILLPYSPFHSGDRTFIEEAAEYLQHTSGREDLSLLLTEDGAWEAFVAEAELSRSPMVKGFLLFSWFLFPFLWMVHPFSPAPVSSSPSALVLTGGILQSIYMDTPGAVLCECAGISQ